MNGIRGTDRGGEVVDLVDEMLRAHFAGRTMYPSRVKYLRSIVRTVSSLPTERQHVILALNSSVAAQRLLGASGYDFRTYFNVFRERALAGDFVLRIFCVSHPQIGRPSQQVSQFGELISQRGLDVCLNAFRLRPEPFNCVYIVPVEGSRTDNAGLTSMFSRLLNEDDNGLRSELLSRLRMQLVLDDAILYHEIPDYDDTNSDGCGYRSEFQSLPDDNRAKIANYFSLFDNSISFADRGKLAEVGAFDVAFVVALPEELQAIEKRVDGHRLTEICRVGGIIYYRAVRRSSNGRAMPLLIAKLPEGGNLHASIATTYLLHAFDTPVVVGLGIAGGLKGKVSLGDVVVGSVVVYYEKKKLEGETERPDVRILESTWTALGRRHDARAFAEGITEKAPSGSRCDPRAHFDGAILSGEKVIGEATTLRAARSRIVRKIVAVDNEAAGIYLSARAVGNGVQFVSIKGISDFADKSKDDRWHAYAADAAAAYVFHYLDRQAPL